MRFTLILFSLCTGFGAVAQMNTMPQMTEGEAIQHTMSFEHWGAKIQFDGGINTWGPNELGVAGVRLELVLDSVTPYPEYVEDSQFEVGDRFQLPFSQPDPSEGYFHVELIGMPTTAGQRYAAAYEWLCLLSEDGGCGVAYVESEMDSLTVGLRVEVKPAVGKGRMTAPKRVNGNWRFDFSNRESANLSMLVADAAGRVVYRNSAMSAVVHDISLAYFGAGVYWYTVADHGRPIQQGKLVQARH